MAKNVQTATLRQALAAIDLPFVHDPDRDTVEVAGYTVWPWATEAPFALYGPGDLLPRHQFDGLPALLAYLRRNLPRAA